MAYRRWLVLLFAMTCGLCLAMQASALTVTTMTPNNGLNTNAALNVTIWGSGFANPATVKLQKLGESDIWASSVVVANSAKITAQFDLTGALVGVWNLYVQCGVNSVTKTNFFAVQQGIPVVSSITPNIGTAGTSLFLVSITGTGFGTSANTTVKLKMLGQSDINAPTPVVLNPNSLVLGVFALPSGALAGLWDVVVTVSGRSGSLVRGFTMRFPAPTITGFGPPTSGYNGCPGDTPGIPLTGTRFLDNAFIYLTDGVNPDIPAHMRTFNSSTSYTVWFDLAHQPAGLRDIVLVNLDGQSAQRNGVFTILDALATTVTVDQNGNPMAGTHLETINLTAKLTSGGPLTGRTLCFFVDGNWVGNQTTDGSGVATQPYTLLIPAGPHTVTVDYKGENQYAPSSGSNTLNVAAHLPNPPVTVNISPLNATIVPGASQTYTVDAADSLGNHWAPDPTTDILWHENGLGAFNAGTNTYVSVPAQVDEDVEVWCEVPGAAGTQSIPRAALHIRHAVPQIVGWDRDDQQFYVTFDASNPASGILIPTGASSINGTSFSVSGTTGNKTCSITSGGVPTNSLRVIWTMRSGAVYTSTETTTIGATYVYSFFVATNGPIGTSNIGAMTHAGFWGQTLNMNASPPTSLSRDWVQQP